MPTALKLLLLFVAGGLGTLARYGLSGLVQRLSSPSFPWGTAVVNLLGCLLFGLLWALALDRGWIHHALRPILFVGFLGGFTTFSSLAFETYGLARDAEWLAASLNLFGQGVLGLGCVWAGLTIGRFL